MANAERSATSSRRPETTRASRSRLRYTLLELDGARYAVLREAALHELARRAGVQTEALAAAPVGGVEVGLDQGVLAGRLLARRRAAGLSQAELARRAAVRVETLNRIERGKTSPDFSTVRKLVRALAAAERAGGIHSAFGSTRGVRT